MKRPKQRAALIRLFRILMKATKELPQNVCLKETVADVAPLCNLLPNNGLSNVQKLRDHIRSSFRRRDCSDSMEVAIGKAVEGVRQLDLLLGRYSGVQDDPMVTSSSFSSSSNETDDFNKQVWKKIFDINEERLDSVILKDKNDFDCILSHDFLSDIKWLPSLLPSDEETPSSHQSSSASTNDFLSDIQWLPSLLPTDEETPSSHQSSAVANVNAEKATVFPLLPLSEPFYKPGKPIRLSSHLRYNTILIPGQDQFVPISEPRYRKMYGDMIASGERIRFVVPFSHPTNQATYAATGLLYEMTYFRQVEDKTIGEYYYFSSHLIKQPVRIIKVLNPHKYNSKDSYLTVLGELVENGPKNERFPLVEKELEELIINSGSDHFALECLMDLQEEGLWRFVEFWIKGLKKHLEYIEMDLVMEEDGDDEEDFAKQQQLGRNLSQNQRAEIDTLIFEIALWVPKLLQANGTEERTQVLLQMIAAERCRHKLMQRMMLYR